MASVIAFFVANKVVILGILLALSEALALIPSVKANSVFQLVFGWLQKQEAPKV